MNLKDVLFMDLKDLKKKSKADPPAAERAEKPPEPVKNPEVTEAVESPAVESKPAEQPIPKPKRARVRMPKEAETPKAEKPTASARVPTVRAPRIKMPDISLPAPVAGAVDNLRERGMLPVAIVLVVAIFAVPFLLSGGSSSKPPAANPAASLSAGGGDLGQQAVVLANAPGIREYKKRLDGSEADPFKQQYAAPPSGGGTAATGVSQTSSGTASQPAGPTTSASTASAPGGNASGNAAAPHTQPVYHYQADLYVGLAGQKMKLRKNVAEMTSLPNDNVRAAAYLGVPFDRPTSVQFLISGDVVTVGGKAHCALGTGTCNAVSLKVGEQMTLAMADGTVYAVKVAGTHLVRDERFVHTNGK